LLDRARSMTELARNSPAGELRRDEFLSATQPSRLSALEAIHEQRDGLALIALLDEAGIAAEFAPAGEYLLGEGYRLRGLAGDEDRALAHYDQSILAHPEFALAYAARGRMYARRGERERAASDLARFLDLEPGAREAAFARQTLERLQKEISP
jgi:tetratricopeptide (TPR) repeat protein